MTWLIIRKFWPAALAAFLLGVIWFQSAQVAKVRKDRDQWHSSALAFQQSAASWEASFRQAEKTRLAEQGASVGALNASEASCDQRVAKARSSAIKIEKVVNAPVVCKPGEAIERRLLDPSALAASLQ